MTMFGGMTVTCMRAAAGCRLTVRDAEHVLVDVIAVRAMEMAVVKIVDVIVMPKGGVAAVSGVLVAVARVSVVIHTLSTA